MSNGFDVEGIQGMEYEDPVSAGINQPASALFNSDNYVKVIREYLTDDNSDIKNYPQLRHFWGVLSKDIKLTFIEPNDIIEFINEFHIAKYNFLMSIPPYAATFDLMIMLDQLRLKFRATLRRAVGTKSHVLNERTMQATAISQSISSSTGMGGGGKPNGGGSMLSKLRGIF